MEAFKGLPVPVIGDEINRLGCMDASFVVKGFFSASVWWMFSFVTTYG